MIPMTQTDQSILRFLGRHLVAMCGSFVRLDDNGNFIGDAKYYARTGFVVTVNDHWCIATAGHVLEELELAKSSPHKVRMKSQVIADYFGPDAAFNHPHPFDPLDQPCMYLHDEAGGVDFGIVHLREYFRNWLAGNGVVPFTPAQWNFPQDKHFEGYHVIGFPEEYASGHASSNGASMIGHVRPTMVPVERIPDDSGKRVPRFKGRIIDKGNQESIRGMSGGPIIGHYRDGPDTKYLLVAVQSKWNEVDAVYGCSMPVFMGLLAEQLKRSQTEETRESSSGSKSGNG